MPTRLISSMMRFMFSSDTLLGMEWSEEKKKAAGFQKIRHKGAHIAAGMQLRYDAVIMRPLDGLGVIGFEHAAVHIRREEGGAHVIVPEHLVKVIARVPEPVVEGNAASTFSVPINGLRQSQTRTRRESSVLRRASGTERPATGRPEWAHGRPRGARTCV